MNDLLLSSKTSLECFMIARYLTARGKLSEALYHCIVGYGKDNRNPEVKREYLEIKLVINFFRKREAGFSISYDEIKNLASLLAESGRLDWAEMLITDVDLFVRSFKEAYK